MLIKKKRSLYSGPEWYVYVYESRAYISRLAATGTMSSAGRAITSADPAHAPTRPIPWRDSLRKR